eukprot:SAG31_NODE_5018_length_2799_cov_2.610000_1_plen_142_part_00
MCLPIAKMGADPKDDKGRFTSFISGRVVFDPNLKPIMTRTDGNYGSWSGNRTGAAMLIPMLSVVNLSQLPFTHEIPQAIMDHMIDEPTGRVAECWRLFVRSVLAPELSTVADLLEANSSAIELPPAEYMNERCAVIIIRHS